MKCQDVQGQLSDYRDFSLSAGQLGLVEEHLAACPTCREETELLDESIRQIAALPVLDPPFGFTQRVMAHLREQETQPSFWQRFLLPLTGKLPIQATVVATIGFLIVYLLQTEQPYESSRPAPETITTTASLGEQDASLTAREPSGPGPSVNTRRQSSPLKQTTQIAAAPQPPPESREEISSHVEAPVAESRTTESLPNPIVSHPVSQPTMPDVPVRPTPVLSVPAPASSGATPISPLSDPDVSAVRPSPQNIEPFADLELILRRHTTPPTVDVVRKTEVGQPAGPRPIERLMAAIPDRTRPQTIWINVPENQYEHFKNELYAIGIIESESRVPMLREHTAGGDGQIRVKLTTLPAAETATPNHPNGR